LNEVPPFDDPVSISAVIVPAVWAIVPPAVNVTLSPLALMDEACVSGAFARVVATLNAACAVTA